MVRDKKEKDHKNRPEKRPEGGRFEKKKYEKDSSTRKSPRKIGEARRADTRVTAPREIPQRDITEDIPKLEGRNPILEALKSGRTIEKMYIAKGVREGSLIQIISMAKDKGIVIHEVDREKLDAMSETRSHQGVIAIVSPYKYVEVDEILDDARRKGEPPFIILLDEIYDPNNLGSILRTANACGAHGVIISKRRAVGLTPAVAKSSAGAIEYVKVSKVTNIVNTIKYLKEQGVWIAGADMDGRKMYFEADLTGPIALVIGSEGQGIGKLVKENCDFIIRLPMMGEISSLNAGVAGAVAMYEIVRQRILKG